MHDGSAVTAFAEVPILSAPVSAPGMPRAHRPQPAGDQFFLGGLIAFTWLEREVIPVVDEPQAEKSCKTVLTNPHHQSILNHDKIGDT